MSIIKEIDYGESKMSIIKEIDYVDGGYHYNRAEILEAKEYVVAHLTEEEDGVVVRDGGNVWFPPDNMPIELADEEIEAIRNNITNSVEDESTE